MAVPDIRLSSVIFKGMPVPQVAEFPVGSYPRINVCGYMVWYLKIYVRIPDLCSLKKLSAYQGDPRATYHRHQQLDPA